MKKKTVRKVRMTKGEKLLYFSSIVSSDCSININIISLN